MTWVEETRHVILVMSLCKDKMWC